MAIVFKHRYKSDSLIGTGTYKFRPYTIASPLPQLATPQNVAITGSEASWDFVDNATAYDVVINGATFGTVDSNAGNYDYISDETTGELTVLSASYEKDGNVLTIV